MIFPKTLRSFIWFFIRKKKIWLMFSCIVAILSAMHITMIPYMIKNLIDYVDEFYKLQPQGIELYDYVFWPAILFVTVVLTHGINYRAIELSECYAIPKLQKDARSLIIEYMSGHSYKYFQDNLTGNIANKVIDIVRGMQSLMHEMIFKILPGISTIIMAVLVVSTANYIFSFIFFIWAIVFVTVVYRSSLNTKKKSQQLSENNSKLTGKIVDIFGSILSVKLFSRYDYEKLEMDKLANTVVSNDRYMRLYMIKMNAFQILINISLMSTVITTLIMTKESVGNIALMLSLYNSITTMTWYVSSRISEFAQEWGRCSQAIKLLSADYDIKDDKDSIPISVTKGDIKFNDVNFYFNKGKYVFKNLNVHIKSGEKIGVVGFSGAGKSTFINLLLRFLEPKSGTITIDEQDIIKVSQSSLRDSITVIPQDIYLFHRTILENIQYGNIDATREEVIEAAKIAHCHDFISVLNEGYDSLIGERGIKLSTGQRQRIAIARAVLKNNTRILILDEATSALDSITEKKIQDSLEYVMKNKTVIAVAHRLSTLDKVDKIIVFDNGKIVEFGNHNELLEMDGHYKRLWNMQVSGFLPTVSNKS